MIIEKEISIQYKAEGLRLKFLLAELFTNSKQSILL
jgi:hypothetical protein